MSPLWIKIAAALAGALVVIVITVNVVIHDDTTKNAPKKDAFTEQFRKTPIQNTGRDKGY